MSHQTSWFALDQLLIYMKANSPYYYVEHVRRARQPQNIEQESWLVLHNPRIWGEQPESHVNFNNEISEQTRKNWETKSLWAWAKREEQIAGSNESREKKERGWHHHKPASIKNIRYIVTSFSLPLSDLCCQSQRSYHVTMHLYKQPHISAMNPNYPEEK